MSMTTCVTLYYKKDPLCSETTNVHHAHAVSAEPFQERGDLAGLEPAAHLVLAERRRTLLAAGRRRLRRGGRGRRRSRRVLKID